MAKQFNIVFFFILLILLSGFSFFISPFKAFGINGPPQILSYQGRLTDANGDLLGGSGTTYYFRFYIYDASSGGSQLWPSGSATACSHAQTVREGVFTAGIGDTTECSDVLDYDFHSNGNVYLEVRVSSNDSSFETLTPRQRITSAPFAQLTSSVGGFASSSASTFGTETPIGASIVSIEATSTSAIPLSLRGIASQVANLFQVQNSGGTNLFYIDNVGDIFASGLASFIQASSTRLSIFDTLFIGGTATSTIQGETTGTSTIQGFLNVAGTNSTSTFSGGLAATYLNLTGTAATSTFANGLTIESGSLELKSLPSCSGGSVLETDANGAIICGADDGAGSMAIGGTVTSGTVDSVLFVDSSAQLAQNNTNFFWDNTLLSLNATQASSSRISVFDVAYFGGTATSTFNATGLLTLAAGLTMSQNENITLGAETLDHDGTNFVFSDTIQASTGSTIGNLTLANGSITDSGGSITFGNENLDTTGTLAAGAATLTSFISQASSTVSAELNVQHLFASSTLAVDGVASFASNLVPLITDGSSLGTSALNFSDLFLDTGGVINFEAGDVTITHSANALAFAGVTGDYTFDDSITPATDDGAALGVRLIPCLRCSC